MMPLLIFCQLAGTLLIQITISLFQEGLRSLVVLSNLLITKKHPIQPSFVRQGHQQVVL